MTDLRHRLGRRVRLWAGFRCTPPVVVLESDDWGLRRRPAAEAVAPWGRPTGWADECSETSADVEALAEVLSGHRDPEGRVASFTMNVVTANPDFDAIEASGFTAYADRPVDQTLDPATRAALRAGVDAGVFALELHGRSHLNTERWLEDLRAGHPGARELFAERVDGGLSLVAEESWRYHSELLDWSTGQARSVPDLVDWLTPAVETIERLAGERPRTATAPHYVLTDQAEAAWADLGIAYVQATEYQLHPDRPNPRPSFLGQAGGHGLTHLTRTARFDPRPGRDGHHVTQTAATIRRCFDQHLPAVVDTHRINFTGPWAADARAELDALLTAADEAGARYLTSAELGDALVDHGRFRDRTNGAPRRLAPVGQAASTLSRLVTRRR